MAMRLIAIILLSVVGLTGCERESSDAGTLKNPRNDPQQNDFRIVSLSPAISRTLMDFNLQDHVVGRSPYCAALDQSIAVVGDLTSVNYEQLIRLHPTHILVQPPASGIDPHLVKMADQHGWKIGQWPLNGRDDIEQMVRELPVSLFAQPDPRRTEAVRKSAEILNTIAQALSPGPVPVFAGRTLLVNSVSPVMAFGSGTYLHDVLAALGAKNIVLDHGWVSLSMEDVVRLDPEAIIVVKPGADRDINVIEAAGPLKGLNVAAIRNRRVAVLKHPDAFIPSSGLVGVAQELRSILQSFDESPR